MAYFSAPSFSSQDKIRKLIEDIATANQLCENSPVSFSSACRGCGSACPLERHASTACGHALCRACAYGKTACPGCKKATRFVKMVENVDRSCCICFSDSPRFLDVFSGCGHSICSFCSKRMQQDSESIATTSIACPLCRIESAPFSLVETAQGVPSGAFPEVNRASDLFKAIEREELQQVLQQRLLRSQQHKRPDSAARNDHHFVHAHNVVWPNYIHQRNAQLEHLYQQWQRSQYTAAASRWH